jgi:hypothetical protein
MVKILTNSVLAVVVLIQPAFALTPLDGPSFYNGGESEIDLHVSTETAPDIHLLKSFPPKSLFTERRRIEVKEVRVVAQGKTFHLRQSDVAKLRQGLAAREQIWVFDGDRVCVIRKRAFDPNIGVQCPVQGPR